MESICGNGQTWNATKTAERADFYTQTSTCPVRNLRATQSLFSCETTDSKAITHTPAEQFDHVLHANPSAGAQTNRIMWQGCNVHTAVPHSSAGCRVALNQENLLNRQNLEKRDRSEEVCDHWRYVNASGPAAKRSSTFPHRMIHLSGIQHFVTHRKHNIDLLTSQSRILTG